MVGYIKCDTPTERNVFVVFGFHVFQLGERLQITRLCYRMLDSPLILLKGDQESSFGQNNE